MKNAYRFLLFSILFASLTWQGCHCNDRQNEVTISGNSNPQAVSVPSHSQININAQTVPDGYNLEALRDILRYEKFSGQIDRDYLQNLLNRPEVNNLDVNSDGQKDFVYPILYDQDGVKGFTINLPNPNAPDQPLEIAAVTFKSVGGQHSMYVDGNSHYYPQHVHYHDPLGSFMAGYFWASYWSYRYDPFYWRPFYVNPYAGFNYRYDRGVMSSWDYRQTRTRTTTTYRTQESQNGRQYTEPRKANQQDVDNLAKARQQQVNAEQAHIRATAPANSMKDIYSNSARGAASSRNSGTSAGTQTQTPTTGTKSQPWYGNTSGQQQSGQGAKPNTGTQTTTPSTASKPWYGNSSGSTPTETKPNTGTGTKPWYGNGGQSNESTKSTPNSGSSQKPWYGNGGSTSGNSSSQKVKPSNSGSGGSSTGSKRGSSSSRGSRKH